jgi:hypothetical protein
MDKSTIEQWLNKVNSDSSVARAEIARFLVKIVYDFVKFNRSEGEGLDGRDGAERRSLAKVVDAAENHYSAMLKEKYKDKLSNR